MITGIEPVSEQKANGRYDVEVTVISDFTGATHVRTVEMGLADWHAWSKGEEPIQNAFPYMSADDREFLMTGATPEEWENLFA